MAFGRSVRLHAMFNAQVLPNNQRERGHLQCREGFLRKTLAKITKNPRTSRWKGMSAHAR